MGSKSTRPKTWVWTKTTLVLLSLERKRNYLTSLRSGLASGFKMKLVTLSLSFPTHIRALQTDTRTSSYDMDSEKMSNYGLFSN
jgi:hypothetical protein